MIACRNTRAPPALPRVPRPAPRRVPRRVARLPARRSVRRHRIGDESSTIVTAGRRQEDAGHDGGQGLEMHGSSSTSGGQVGRTTGDHRSANRPCLEGLGLRASGGFDRARLVSRPTRDVRSSTEHHRCGTAPDSHRTSHQPCDRHATRSATARRNGGAARHDASASGPGVRTPAGGDHMTGSHDGIT